jgi:hypothetical protein
MTRWRHGMAPARQILSTSNFPGDVNRVAEFSPAPRSDQPRALPLQAALGGLKRGFEAIGVRRGYYKGADAIVMRRVADGDRSRRTHLYGGHHGNPARLPWRGRGAVLHRRRGVGRRTARPVFWSRFRNKGIVKRRRTAPTVLRGRCRW